MTHTPQEQPKKGVIPEVQNIVVEVPKAFPEVLCTPHDILGKEYEFNGVSFVVLGMEPVYFDGDNAIEGLRHGVISIVNIQTQRIPVIPFHGGVAQITKIQIGSLFITGYREIIHTFHTCNNLPRVDSETEIYTDPEDGTQWASTSYFARKYSLFYETAKNYFMRDGVPSRQGKKQSGKETTLFDVAAGESSLKKLALLPQSNIDGCYRDESGITWAPLGAFRSYYDIDTSSVKRLLSDMSTMPCRDRANNSAEFYRFDEAIKIIEQYVALPKVDRKTGYYEDQDGVRWYPAKYFRNKYDIGSTTFKAHAGHIRSIDGRSQGTGKTKLYNHDEAEKALQSFLALPAVNKDTGTVQDKEGVIWITENKFCTVQAVSQVKFHSMLDGVPMRKGRGANGMKSALYRLDALQKKFKDFLSLPVIDKQTGMYRDDSGKKWASLPTIADLIGVSVGKLVGVASEISSIRGRDKSGEENTLYSVKEFKKALEDFVQLPKVDKSTGIYTDVGGMRWMPLRLLADRLGIGEAALKSLSPIARIQGRDRSGQEGDLLNIEDAESAFRDFQALPHVEKNGVYIDELGDEWQQIVKATERFGKSRQFLENKGIQTRIGRTWKNVRTKLCRVKDIEALIGGNLSGIEYSS